MKKDIGFWNEQGKYIPDIQEVSEVEMDNEKEIIIDGVDVAGCEYILNNKIKGKQHCPNKSMPYAKETSCVCRKSIDTPYNFCKHNPNCHYKQLKRLEFELKVTKADYEASEQENAELKTENERLKTLFCKEQDLIKLIERTQDDYEKCILQKEHFEKRAKKAENCLQEIKKCIAKICKEECGYVQKKRCPDCDCRFGAILDLITKAEEE